VHSPLSSVTSPTLISDELARAVAARQAILFAGAGLSMSVGLPSWQEFAHRMAEELGVVPDLLQVRGVGYHTLAEYYRLKQGSIGPLRSWMDRTWTVSREKVRQSKLHELIIELDFPLIYTTNYDRNIEEAYAIHGKDFVKVSNARDIAKTREGITEIIKFHGDFDDDNSLVITETDYFNRLSFDSPLDIKFRSDALAKTVLFIGYSMTDMNIRLLLHNLWRTWQTSGYERDRPKSFVFMANANPLQSAILEQWGITAISGEEDDPQEALTQFLIALKDRVDELNGSARA
jgi:hypothetical protein